MSAVLLPCVCAWCDRVRTSAGRWEEAEVSQLDPAGATHGICPECLIDATRAASREMELR